MTSNAHKVKKELLALSSLERARVNAWFFKTGRGQYGEGDEFIGVTVPNTRKIAKKYVALSFLDIEKLLHSKKHEYRLCALLILVLRYQKGTEQGKKEVFDFYLNHLEFVNNWDLVDLSAYHIVGAHAVSGNDFKLLLRFVKNATLWKRRIAIVSTYAFIREGIFEPTLQISNLLLRDKEDLMHKAIGWMLREVGKRDVAVLRKFLHEHWSVMPRTTLRYAIERFEEKERKKWLTLGKKTT